MPTKTLRSARRHYLVSAALAARATREAGRASEGDAVIATVVAHQAAQARLSEMAVAAMLTEQALKIPAEGRLNALAFTTSTESLRAMLRATQPANLDRLIAALVQNAGRAAEGVAVAVRKGVGHVRYVQPPCCARCAILAGRWYRFSDGFRRHPGCDCTMIPTTQALAESLIQDPAELARSGQIYTTRVNKRTGEIVKRPGLSRADMQAFLGGANLAKLVNEHRAGLQLAGDAIGQDGKPSPDTLLRQAKHQQQVHDLLHMFDYLL